MGALHLNHEDVVDNTDLRKMNAATVLAKRRGLISKKFMPISFVEGRRSWRIVRVEEAYTYLG